MDNKDNYFFQLILLGKFLTPDSVPPYLKRENFPILKSVIDRIEVYNGITTDILKRDGAGSFNKFSLSNIFEWMENEVFNAVMREVIELSRPESRLCFRYTLAKARELDEANLEIMTSEPELAKELHLQDRSFMYESFHVYSLNK
jgi:S-adenosylmethionine-diacylglycerol 3-amino-3-carboxypropyl transferase